VRKVIRSEATEFRYERESQPLPKIGPWTDQLDELTFAPGEAYQFDWSHEIVLLDGVTVMVTMPGSVTAACCSCGPRGYTVGIAYVAATSQIFRRLSLLLIVADSVSTAPKVFD
jgi:hypothetical protein